MQDKMIFNPRYIIPHWDTLGNAQMFLLQLDGLWLDTFNQVFRSQAWIDQYIAPRYKLAPDGISMVDYLEEK
jgi:hypothetical protein